jgi:hypothetical protein
VTICAANCLIYLDGLPLILRGEGGKLREVVVQKLATEAFNFSSASTPYCEVIHLLNENLAHTLPE